VLLLVHGISTRAIGESGTPSRTSGSGSPLSEDTSLLSTGNERTSPLRSAAPSPGKRIALTFDDGPDPRWTPRIAATLRRLGVPATFFVMGSQVARHPDIAQRLHRDGFELGNHTFTHTAISAGGAWRRSLELGLTERAVAGAVGVRPRLVRPPYSSSPDAVTSGQVGPLASVAERGYLIALSDLDTKDWQKPPAEAIVRRAVPSSGEGGMVLMHDGGGGDRSATLAALPRLVSRLRAKGFGLVRASELASLPRAAAEVPASPWESFQGSLLIGSLAISRAVVGGLGAMLAVIAALAIARTFVLFALARQHRRLQRRVPFDSTFHPPMSVIVPAFNESVGIERAVRSLAASDYPDFEVVVVDDGSTDGTGEIVEALELPQVRLVHQANAGKAAALNRGMSETRHEIIAMVDGDTVFEPDTLCHLVRPFADSGVGAVSGNTKVGNRRGLLGRWQHIEYVMGFNLDRRLYDVLRCMPTVPGAVGGFRRRALADIGGVSEATLAEDTDITLGVGRAGWRVVYAGDARGWTEAPSNLSGLWRQRYRWSYGTMQAVWKHRAAIWRPGEERIGRRAIPYLVLFQIALPMLAPIVDVFALYGLLFLDPLPVVAYWVGFNALQLLLGVYAFRLDGEPARPLWAVPLQQFVYRQLMYLVVIESVITALMGKRLAWQNVERSGDVEVTLPVRQQQGTRV
jgi:cellulose synthase/poly-beta-1,6-N-acetylglucosamine synthase-like glycosyltransferase/peptidoglycan/xylan/chitin deacetylase (PgdA/CDA1 family)